MVLFKRNEVGTTIFTSRLKWLITICIRKKSNTKMNKYTVIHTIIFSKQQSESLQKLKDYDVNVSQFIRLAISEKIKRDWKQIKEKKERVKLPF